MSLDPDGWLVRRNTSRRHSNENTDASEITNRGWGLPIGTQRKNCQKLCKGDVLPLDRSLLSGDFSCGLGVSLGSPLPTLHSPSHPQKSPVFIMKDSNGML